MINFKTNIPEIDAENAQLFIATKFLQKCGDKPGLTLASFHKAVIAEMPDISEDHYQSLVSAAIAIETMMTIHESQEEDSLYEPTQH
mgnify:CR=1 FL=1